MDRPSGLGFLCYSDSAGLLSSVNLYRMADATYEYVHAEKYNVLLQLCNVFIQPLGIYHAMTYHRASMYMYKFSSGVWVTDETFNLSMGGGGGGGGLPWPRPNCKLCQYALKIILFTQPLY